MWCMSQLVPKSDKLRDVSLQLYQRSFEITGGGFVETFLDMEVEEQGNEISLRLDTDIQDIQA